MRRLVGLVVGCVGIGSTGCATLPQPTPLLGEPGTQIAEAISFATPYAPTRVVVRVPDRPPIELRGRFDVYDSAPLQALFDPREALSFRAADWLRIGLHLDNWMGGGELDILPRGSSSDMPIVIAIGGQAHIAPLALLSTPERPISDVRAQLSIHPRVGAIQGVFGAGFSFGLQRHELLITEASIDNHDADGPHAMLRAYRREGRVEGTLGVSFPFISSSRLELAVQPYYAVVRGDLHSVSCTNCETPVQLEALDASWGAAFTISLQLSQRIAH